MAGDGKSRTPPFLSGGGEMGERIRAFDWAGTPFGPPERWPAPLRTMLDICLHSSVPTAIYWGPELRLLYNDAWAPIAAERHPAALGQPGQAVWPDIWSIVGPQFAEVMRTGEGFSVYDQLLPMVRGGVARETYWNYSFTAIRDDDGVVQGVLNQGHETSALVAARRSRELEIERWREMFLQAPGAVAILRGPQHVFELANESYMALVGNRTIIGKSVGDALPEVREQGFIALLDQVFTTGEPFLGHSVPLSLMRNGQPEPRVLDFIYQPIRDGAGAVTGIFVQATDVTERDTAVSALRRNEERLQLALTAGNSIGIWDWDVVNNRVTADRRFAQLYGVDPDEAATGAPIAHFFQGIHPDDRPALNVAITHALETGAPLHAEYRLLAKDGSIRWVTAQGQCTLDSDGKPIRFPGVSFDITERKRNEVALLESEKRFRLVAESAPVMLWMGDENGRCVYLNRAQREFWGVPEAEISTFRWDTTVLQADAPRLLEPFRQGMQTRSPFSTEARFRRADGVYRILRTDAHPRFGADGAFLGMIGVNVDVTDEVRSTERREALLELSDRLRDLTDPDDIAYTSAEILARTLDVSRAGYGTVDVDAETITIARDWNAPGIRTIAGVLRFRDYGSYIENIKRGETVAIADASLDPRTAAGAASLKAISALSFVNMPVTEQGNTVALLYLNHAEAREWTPDELAFVREVANRARVTTERRRVENALRQETARLQLLNRTGAAVAAQLDLDSVVQTITDAGVELTGAQFGAFFYNVLDQNGESYMLYALSGVPRESFAGFPMPRATAIFRPTFNGDGIVRSDDITTDPRYGRSAPYNGMPPGHLPVRSYLAVPVTSRTGEVLGGLFFGHDQVGVFSEEHEALLAGIAGQAASSIDNARLFNAVERELAERRRAESALRESEARFRGITNSIEQMIWSTQPDGYHDYYNDRWYEYTGMPYGSTDGEAWNGVFHPDDQERAWAVWRHSLATGEPYHIEYRLRHRSGQYRWVLGRAQAVRDAEGTITRWFGTCTDIQDIVEARDVLARSRVELEREVQERTQELMAAEAQLRQAQKMEAVGQLTGGIAHDFNNMLAVVIGGLNLLQRRLARGDTDVSKYVDAAMDGATRAASLTQRLLAFSRQQPLSPEPIDANRMVAGMSELLRRSLGEQIRIETVLAAGLWRTSADPVQLENAILNLSVNARDAMPQGGNLTIETANTHVDDDYAREYQIVAGQYVLIAVTDTGTGMSPEVMTQAFDPFFTTKGVGQGTGLGLSQVFGFVRQSGGHVKLYSEIGVGTSVKIYLPRFYGDAVAPQPRREIAAGGGHPSEVVLVVEDEERVRNYSTEALRELGYTVIVAADAAHALRLLATDEPVTMLFTDVVMPEMTGRELADRALLLRPDLKVLFTTGYTRNAVVHNGVLDAGTNFLPKPFGIDQLAAKVRTVLDS